MTLRHLALALLLPFVLVALAGCADAPTASREPDWALVENRLWLSHLPKSETELSHQLFFFDQGGQRVGARADASKWRVVIDLFEWSKTSTGAAVRFPQYERSERWALRAWRCDGEAQRPFELCMTVNVDGPTRRYYSRVDWVIAPGEHDDPAAAMRAAAALALERAR